MATATRSECSMDRNHSPRLPQMARAFPLPAEAWEASWHGFGERYWIAQYAAAGAMLANIMHNPTFANPETREQLKRFFRDMVDITALVGHRLNTAHPSFR